MERRREVRFPVSLTVEMHRDHWEPHVVGDISPGGLFVRAATGCPLRQLVQVRVPLEAGQAPLEILGTVTHTEPVWDALSQGRIPGLGLELRYMSPAQRDRWRALVEEAREEEAREGAATDPVLPFAQRAEVELTHEEEAIEAVPAQPVVSMVEAEDALDEEASCGSAA